MIAMSSLVKREVKALWRDPWQLALVSYVPLIGIFCIWWLFSAALPRHLNVAVVDFDNSSLSRSLTRRVDANPASQVVSYPDLLSAKQAMQAADVYAILVLPPKMRKDLLTGHSPVIDIRYNSQFLLVGKLLSSQIQSSLADGLSQVASLKQFAAGVPKPRAEVNLQPVSRQVTALYNRNSNYVVFLLPPVLVALGQLLGMLIFANSLNRELRLGTMKEWFSHGIWRGIAVKAIVYVPLVVLQGRLILALLYQFLGLSLAGSFGQLLIAQLVMLLAIWLLVVAIFFLLQDSARVVSFCSALFAPAFPFMGITFPTHDMPLLAQWWRKLMPSSHYIDSHVGVVSYGQSWSVFMTQLTSYWGYGLLIPLIIVLAIKVRNQVFSEQNALAGGV